MKRSGLSFKFRIAAATLVLALSVPAVWAYVTTRSFSNTNDVVQVKWSPKAFPITWQMNPTQGTNVTGSASQETVFKAAFNAWQGLSTASITFSEGTTANVQPGLDGINVITTVPSNYPNPALLGLTTVFSVDQAGGTVDFAGQIVEADIMFNPSIQFSTEPITPAGKYDLQSVATHEVGHFLGMDHTTMLNSTMFWTLTSGASYARTLSADDIAGVSSIYPTASFQNKGTIAGTVRTNGNVAVYGAAVTVLNSNGQPVASAITGPDGKYSISGLDAGSYSVYAQPLTGPTSIKDIPTITRIYPGATVFTNFTTRFR